MARHYARNAELDKLLTANLSCADETIGRVTEKLENAGKVTALGRMEPVAAAAGL